MPEGEHFTLSSGSITPLPASLLSISTPLPPSPIKDTDPPPLPIRIPMMTSTSSTPNSPTPRVIHYAGASKSDNNLPNTINWSHTGIRPAGGQIFNQAIRPTGGQLIGQASPRPAAGQLILSTIPRPGLSPTKLVNSGQLSAPVSPRSRDGNRKSDLSVLFLEQCLIELN